MKRATLFTAGLVALVGATFAGYRLVVPGSGLPRSGEPLSTATNAPPAPATTAQQGESKGSADCDLQGDATLFLEALQSFREGDPQALPALTESAARLEQLCGRPDPASIAAFYGSLTQDQRALGLQLEHQFDALQYAAADIPASDPRGTRALRERLAFFLRSTANIADLPVRAYGLSLDARFAVRLLEQGALSEGTASELAAVEGDAREALALFRRAGQSTPTLESLWTLARCALLRSDWNEAELHFSELDDVAQRVGRASWRERGLLGLIGLERERGSLFAIDGLLDDLASFRSPATSWSLAREVAVQQIQRDEPEAALRWLDEHPPSELDGELEGNGRLAYALDEWRSLTSAAELRSGNSEGALERLSDGSGSVTSDLAVLTQATIYLESNEPGLALSVVRSLPSVDVDRAGLTDRWKLEGLALLELNRPSEAIAPLERALDLARSTDTAGVTSNDARRARCDVQSGSRMGEWLGLSAVESLGRAYVETGDPLSAAVLFEWIHARTLTRAECEAEILGLSAASTCGYITWMVGADQTLAIHVAPNGAAEALPVNVDRRGIERGVQRLRDALLQARSRDSSHAWRDLGQELCAALLPASARRSLRQGIASAAGADDGPTLALSPHGALERLPFEALILEAGEPPIGVSTALTVLTALRHGRDVAAPLEGRAADWIALGAPSTERYDELPGARRELASIGRMQPRWTVKTGAEMTRNALEAALRSGRPLHLATHVAPLQNTAANGAAAQGIAPVGFVVAGDDIVSAREVLALGPRAPLAILTACGSAEGVLVDGLSVRGMAQTMLASGTRAAIVTLWPIQDRAGERAAVRVHAALLAGASPPEATRRAREFLWLLGEAPSEWAAYRLLR